MNDTILLLAGLTGILTGATISFSALLWLTWKEYYRNKQTTLNEVQEDLEDVSEMIDEAVETSDEIIQELEDLDDKINFTGEGNHV